MTASPLLWLVLAAVIASAGTEWVRRQAVRHGVRDVPNERSSHTVPTPRGGGLAMVVVAIAGWLLLAYGGALPATWLAALGTGGALTALVGGIDDVRSLPARTRFAAHVAAGGATAAAFAAAGGTIQLLPAVALPGAITPLFVVLYVVWSINLFNFMDGIDGIAGGQGASVAAAASLFCLLAGDAMSAAAFALLAGACLGFLTRNWHPARIFMGDVGSGFMGFALAATSLMAEQRGSLSLMLFALLSGTFIVDATYTLIRRLVAGEAVHQAHRDHAYQHATQRGLSHAKVAFAVVALNLGLLAPLTWWGSKHPALTPLLLVAGYAPLLLIAVRLRAGIRGG